MQITRLAVYRPVIALTVAVALALFGIVSYFNLGMEDSPELKLPIVTVTVTYPGASAQTVEEQVTRRVEDAIATLGNIKTMTSVSQTGMTRITVEFTEGINVDVAANDIQQKVSGIQSDLPAEVKEPSYAKLDFNDVPVVSLAVVSDADSDPTRMYRLADEQIRPKLEMIPGVGRAVVAGGAEPEVQVEIQPDRLRAYLLTIDDVTTAVQSQFLTASGGEIKSGATGPSRASSLRIDSRNTDINALGSVPIVTRDGMSVELRNVANVYLGGKEAEQILRVNGKPAVGLLVYKQSTANITKTVDSIIPAVEQLNTQLPDGYNLQLVIDQSTSVRETVNEVQHELMLAALLTGLVLFFFIHSLRSTIIVLLAIPASLLVSLIVLKVAGLTLNGMTLIGLTTAIGVLVDDSIVVLENIFKHLEHGKEPKSAAVDGRSEIGMAAIAITLVDVAVWGPIIGVSGITGAFLRNFAIVIVAATLASLLVSFTLTPLIASRWLSGVDQGRSPLSRIARIWEPLYELLERVYTRTLNWSLHHRPLVIVAAIAVLASNGFIVKFIGSEFVPEADEDVVTVIGEMPAGTALEATDRAARQWERALLNEDSFPEVHTAFVEVGADGDTRKIRVSLEVGKPATREASSKDIGRAAVEAGVASVPELRAYRFTGNGSPGQPVQVRIFNDDLVALTQQAKQAEARLSALPELTDVTNSLTAATEITVSPDAARLRDMGMNARQVASAVRVAYQGAEVGRWTDTTGKERDVRVKVPADLRNRPEAVADLPVGRRGDMPVALRQVATETSEILPTRITRVNRQRVATIGAESNGVPLGAATAAATVSMNDLGVTRWSLAGTGDEQQSSFAALGMGLALSILLMYFVLAVLYESWLQPMLILSALPLASVGGLLGLLVFHQTLSVPSFIGLIALFGLVGKNAILLVDRANDLRKHGMDRMSALQEAGPSRLRPILMTSAVLILSMLPVAMRLGDGGAARAPLGAVLVGGMTTSTVLSLIYVPVAYTYFDSFGVLIGRLFSWRPFRRSQSAVVAAPTSAPIEPQPIGPRKLRVLTAAEIAETARRSRTRRHFQPSERRRSYPASA